MSRQIELCPFCKSDNLNHWYDLKDPVKKREMFWQCSDCGGRGPSYWGFDGYDGSAVPKESTDLWNTRPLEDALQVDIAALEAQLRIQRMNLDTFTEEAALVEAELKARAEKAEAELVWLAERVASICDNSAIGCALDIQCPHKKICDQIEPHDWLNAAQEAAKRGEGV